MTMVFSDGSTKSQNSGTEPVDEQRAAAIEGSGSVAERRMPFAEPFRRVHGVLDLLNDNDTLTL